MHQAAAIEHVPDSEIEALDEQSIGVADRFRLHPPHDRYIHGLKEVVERAVAQGNVILVGRGTNQLVGNREDVFHLRLVAPRPWRARRMAELEGWTQEKALARCTEVDRTRERFNRYFFGDAATQPGQYDLVINTGRVPLDHVVAGIAALVREQWPSGEAEPSAERRILDTDRRDGSGRLQLGSDACPAAEVVGVRPRAARARGQSAGCQPGGAGASRRAAGRDLPAFSSRQPAPAVLRDAWPAHEGAFNPGRRSSSGAVVAGTWRRTLGRFTSAWWRMRRLV